jgi:hypothetical protein
MNMNKTTKTKKVTNGTVKSSSTTLPKPAAQAAAKPASQITPATAGLPITTNSTPAASVASVAQIAAPAPRPASSVKATASEQSTKPKTNVSLEWVSPSAKSVAVAGSFNGWNPNRTPLKPAGAGKWVGELSGISGRHEYLFVVDGQWLPDPKAKESVQNPFGGRNSVLVVPSN